MILQDVFIYVHTYIFIYIYIYIYIHIIYTNYLPIESHQIPMKTMPFASPSRSHQSVRSHQSAASELDEFGCADQQFGLQLCAALLQHSTLDADGMMRMIGDDGMMG